MFADHDGQRGTASQARSTRGRRGVAGGVCPGSFVNGAKGRSDLASLPSRDSDRTCTFGR